MATLNAQPDNDLPALDEQELQQLEQEIAATKAKRIIEMQKKKKQSILMQPYLQKLADADFVPTTAEDLLELVLNKYGPAIAKKYEWENDFIIPPRLKNLYWKLALYFSNDPRMYDHGLSPKRGILIFGNVGSGKTSALEAFENNPFQPFKLVSCGEVVGEYNTDGQRAIDKYSSNQYNEYKSQYFGHHQFGYAFDDLGTEDPGDHFKKIENVFAKIIFNRYSNPSTRGPLTHLTTNITDEDIFNKYGLRIQSRLGEFFNFILLPKDIECIRPAANLIYA